MIAQQIQICRELLRDDRSRRAWANDSDLTKKYNDEYNELNKKVGQLGKEVVEKEKEKIKIEYEEGLHEIALERQNMLYNSSVLVIGSGPLAQMVLGALAGLSVGNIFLMDESRIERKNMYDFLCLKDINGIPRIGKEKVKEIEITLRKINPLIRYTSLFSPLCESLIYRTLKPQTIIEATNDPISKRFTLKYAKQYNIPLISASADNIKAAISCYWPNSNGKKQDKEILESILHKEFDSLRQGIVTSGISAGIVAEEYRKSKFKFTTNGLDNNLETGNVLYYNMYSKRRNDPICDMRYDPVNNLRDKRAVVVGAGALGNFVALALTLMGIGKIDIIDYDAIELSNMNRQIFFYNISNENGEYKSREGEKKSNVLAERLKELRPDTDIIPYVDKIELNKEDIFGNRRRKNYDIIFGCLDNRDARLLLDQFSVKLEIPYIDGGTGYKNGQLAFYIPERTQPISEQLQFPEGKASCLDNPNPSVIMSNMIIANAMVAESLKIFNLPFYENNGGLQRGIFKYDAFDKGRISFSEEF